MSVSEGQFVWYELMTRDPAAATAFYQAVIGWDAADSGLPDHDYTMLSMASVAIGGVMGMPAHAQAAGAGPAWTGYIAVADVDDAAARVREAGGDVHRGPEDIPAVGRFAVVSDPQGALIYLFKGLGEAPTALPPSTPGTIGWRELHAADWEAAFGFYAMLFGWTKGDALDMGPMGTYQLFAIGGVMAGGMMTRMDPGHAPSWLYYFNVADIDGAIGRVKEHGGQIVHGPSQVPGGSWIAHGLDPQGAMFAVVAPG